MKRRNNKNLRDLSPRTRLKVVKKLIKEFNIKLCEDLIIELIRDNDFKTLKRLFSKNIISPSETVFIKQLGHNPLLHVAIYFRSNKTAKEILKYGVPIETKNSKGLTALDVAIESNNAELITLLS